MTLRQRLWGIVALALLHPVHAGAGQQYSILNKGELSPTTSLQWEVSSAVIPGKLADTMCTASTRNAGDPQFFLTWGLNQSIDPKTLITSGIDFSMPCSESSLGACTATPLTLPSGYTWGQDNGTVRLGDGRIVSLFLGGIVSPGAGTNSCGTGDKYKNDLAGDSHIFFVSDSCGQNPWTTTTLDTDKLKDLNGNPMNPVSCASDRPELYADPFSEHLLMTTRIGHWGFPNNFTNTSVLLHAPTAGGVTTLDWRVMLQIPFTGFITMTTLPHANGVSRVYWFTCKGGTDPYTGVTRTAPTLYFADNPWDGQQINGPYFLDYDLYANEGGNLLDYACGGTNSAPDWTPANNHTIRNILGNMSISRLSTDGTNDKIRVLYEQTKTVNSKDYTVMRIVDIDVTPALLGTKITPSTSKKIRL